MASELWPVVVWRFFGSVAMCGVRALSICVVPSSEERRR